MTERLQAFKDYLIRSQDIASSDKRYVMDFAKKEEYLESLRAAATKIEHCRIATGYGNVNSGVCFVFPDENKFQIAKSVVQGRLEKMNINFWDIYVTFIEKTEKPFPNKYNYLMNEINAIKPKAVYVFDDDDSAITAIINEFAKFGKTVDKRLFHFINLKSFILEENTIWKEFMFVPGYAFINDHDEGGIES